MLMHMDETLSHASAAGNSMFDLGYVSSRQTREPCKKTFGRKQSRWYGKEVLTCFAT